MQTAHAAQQGKKKIKKWEENLTDISPKKIYRWPKTTHKDVQHRSLLEKYKSKLQWDITSYQSEWPSSKSLQTINAGEDVEKREPSCTVGGNVNWYSHYERQYGDSLKTRNKAIPLLGIYPEETKVEKDNPQNGRK